MSLNSLQRVNPLDLITHNLSSPAMSGEQRRIRTVGFDHGHKLR